MKKDNEQPRRHALVLRVLLLGSMAAGLLVVGAMPGEAWTNTCNNEATVPAGDDIGIDVGPGLLFVGVDTGKSAGLDGFAVCINDDSTRLTVTPLAGTNVRVDRCTGTTCTPLVGVTGLVGSLSPSTSVGSITVCAGICTSVPGPKVDTGYDIYVNGIKVANVCASVGSAC